MVSSKIYGFVSGDSREPCTSSKFMSEIAPILDRILENPDSQIILSDLSGGCIYVARYLKKKYYRKAILYHVGRDPRINIAEIPTKGGFATPKECREGIVNDSDVLVTM